MALKQSKLGKCGFFFNCTINVYIASSSGLHEL